MLFRCFILNLSARLVLVDLEARTSGVSLGSMDGVAARLYNVGVLPLSAGVGMLDRLLRLLI